MGLFKKESGSKEDESEVQVDPEYAKQVQAKIDALKGCTLSDFDVKETLGTGSFGRVRLVRQKTTGNVFALKILSKSLILKTKQLEHIIAEKEILTSIQHPFIVQLYGTMQDETAIYLILEYVIGGEFFTHLRQANRFPNDTAVFYAAEVVATFDHLHRRNIIYRDLKPENLLIDSEGQLKITDFGFAKRIDPTAKTWTLCGTPEYLAPEIILNKGHGKAVDWWALGILIYEMLVGYPPFNNEDRMQLYQDILQGRIEFPSHVSSRAKDLIKKLLTSDLTRRLGNLRNGARDIKRHPWFRGVDWTALQERRVKAPMVPRAQADDDTSYFDEYPEDEDDDDLFAPVDAKDQKLFKEF